MEWHLPYTIPSLKFIRGDRYNFYKMAFYSDEFTNFPLSLDLTGKSEDFKITIQILTYKKNPETAKDEIQLSKIHQHLKLMIHQIKKNI